MEIKASLTEGVRTAGKTSQIEGNTVVEDLGSSTVAERHPSALSPGTVEQATG